METLTNITPIDGRYQSKVSELSEFFSEYALIKYRIRIEIEYFIALSELGLFKLSAIEKKNLRLLYQKFNIKEAKKVKSIERKTNHDVKAVEYYIKSKTKTSNSEFFHFALTSEDINNLSYSLMLKDGLEGPLYRLFSQLYNELSDLTEKYKKTPMLARTHGQSASPTTLGKEFAIYMTRFKRMVESLQKVELRGKLNGASGNYNAHAVSYPNINWIKFSEKFVKSIGLKPKIITYQIEPHDVLSEIFHALIRICSVIINLNQDMWTYISLGYLGQKVVKGEVGSSTMPHKVNPIDFENSEGNLGLAISIFEHMARKLPITRMQRDLTDSTVIRNQGTALAYMFIAIKGTLKGLSKIQAHENKIKEDLEEHVEVIAEGIQTILRREKADMPYEKLKAITRGKKVTLKDFHKFIDNLKVSKEIKLELKKITPLNYIGKAIQLTEIATK